MSNGPSKDVDGPLHANPALTSPMSRTSRTLLSLDFGMFELVSRDAFLISHTIEATFEV